MIKSLIIGIIITMSIPLLAGEKQFEISEDGWQMAIFDHSQNENRESLVTDVVPYNSSPDWSCDLRMQVGGLAMADLDADGDLDLAVGCYQSQSYPPYDDWRNFILYNIDGELQSSPGWWSNDASSTTDILAADLNDDGYPDIFAANGGFSFDPSKVYYFNTETDSINRTAGWSSADNCFTTGAAAFDFDQDDDIDVATSNQGVSPLPYKPVHIFMNNGDGLETVPSWSSSEEEISGSVAWGDYDQDGWYDLAVSKWANFYSCVYHNVEGIMQTYPNWTADNNDTQKGVAWADVNGDSYPELAIGASGIPTQLYPNNEGMLGSSPVWQSNNSYHGVQDMRWADVDGDGDMDLATVHFSTGHLRIYLNIDGVLETTPSWQYDASQAGTAVEFGDINGDGAVDLIMGVSGQPCVMVFYNTGVTSVDETPELPLATRLVGNYPNPFNVTTRISFYLQDNSAVKLQIYDLGGRLVKTLVDGQCRAGYNNILWDGKNREGRVAATGVYLYRLETNTGVQTSKMVMLK